MCSSDLNLATASGASKYDPGTVGSAIGRGTSDFTTGLGNFLGSMNQLVLGGSGGSGGLSSFLGSLGG